MFKNGLFVITLGMVFFLFSANTADQVYNWPNIIVSLAIVALGGVITYFGHKKDKAKGRQEDGNQ